MRIARNDLKFLVNGSWICAYSAYGMDMGDGFLDTLEEPLVYKDYITNESRLENGKRITECGKPKLAARDLTLIFTIEGENPADFRALKTAFFKMLSDNYGKLVLTVPQSSGDIYHLRYLGKGNEYSRSLDRCFCKIALKFCESDPSDRSA